MMTPIPTPGYWQMTPGGIHVPPGTRTEIPPSPPREYREKMEKEIKRQIVPLRCPGLAPVAWREYQELMPTAIIQQRMFLKPQDPMASLKDASFYYKLEEASGNRVDSTSSANDLSPTSTPGNATGKLGQALAISSLQYVSKSSASAWDMSGWEWTISCWLYITDKTDFRTAICVGGSGHVQYNLQYYKSGFGDAMNLGFEDDGQVGRAALCSNFGSPTLNTWFFCLTYGSATGGVANGARTGIRCNNGTANVDNHKSFYNRSTGLYIGAQFQSSAAYQWAGRIDEVGGWKRLLTQAEQDLLYNSGNGASPF